MRWRQAETQARQAGSFQGCGLAQVTAPVLLAGDDCNARQAGCPKSEPQEGKGGLGDEGRGAALLWWHQRRQEMWFSARLHTQPLTTEAPPARLWVLGGAMCQAPKMQAQERIAPQFFKITP